MEQAGEIGWSDAGHAVLDAAGTVPIVGNIADGLNALWYWWKGDYKNAAMSAGAMVPGAGQGVTGTKYSAKTAKAAARLARINKIRKKLEKLRADKRKLKKGNPEKRVKGREKKKNKNKNCNFKSKKGKPTLVPTGYSQKVDASFIIPGLLGIELSSTYVGDLKAVGPFGYRRASDIDAILEVTEEGKLQLTDAEAFPVLFDRPTPNPEHWEEGDNVRPLFLMAGRRRSYILREEGVFKHFYKNPDGIWRIGHIEDRNGNRLTFSRQPNGRLDKITNMEGISVRFDYNERGLRQRVVMQSSNGEQKVVLRYEYDDRHNLILAECPYGDRIEYAYDENRNLVRHVHNGAYQARHDFDEKGRVLRYHTNNAYNGAHFEYNEKNRITTFYPGSDSEKFEKFYYDEDEDIFAEANALGHIRRTIENDEGYIGKEIDAEGNETSYTYDDDGNVKSITDGEGRTDFYAWDEDGNLEILIDPDGNAWDYHYDEKGNLTAVEDANRFRTDIVNTDQGLPARIMRHDGLMQVNTYDEHHRLTATVNFNGAKTIFTHDDFGRVIAVKDALGAVTRFEYTDQIGWDFWEPSKIIRPDGAAIVHKTLKRGNTSGIGFIDTPTGVLP